MKKKSLMTRILAPSLILFLWNCGADDSNENRSSEVSLSGLKFCSIPAANGQCAENKSQVKEGSTTINSSVSASITKMGSTLSFNWYFVNSSGCRTKLSESEVTTDVDGEQALTASLSNVSGFKKGTYELEIDSAKSQNLISAQFLVL